MRTRIYLPLLALILLFTKANSQQVLFTASNNAIWEDIYLYEGDQLKFEFTGENKKMSVYFWGSSVPAPKEFADRFTKTKDITTYVINVSKEGPHRIGLVGGSLSGKIEGELKLLRIPAPGKANAPTSFINKYTYNYEKIPQSKPRPYETFYKRTIQDANTYGFSSNFYVKKDEQISFTPSAEDQKRATVALNQEDKFWNLDGIVKNQGHIAAQKGDTIYFEITPKFTPSGDYNIWIARPDQFIKLNPDLFGTFHLNEVVPNPLFRYITPSGGTAKGSFVLQNDGLIGFYFQQLGSYDIKIYRFLGKGNDPKFSIKYDIAPVFRSKDENYQLEPIIK